MRFRLAPGSDRPRAQCKSEVRLTGLRYHSQLIHFVSTPFPGDPCCQRDPSDQVDDNKWWER